LAFGNVVGKSANTSIRVRVSTDAHLAGNTLTGGTEGSLSFEHSHGSVLCLNELHSSEDFNVRLFDSHASKIFHNQIRGGDKSLRMIIVNELLLQRNLIADSNNAFSFSGGHDNLARENIFSGQKRFVAETDAWDSEIQIESNLINGGSMLAHLPLNSPDIESNNTVGNDEPSKIDFQAVSSTFGPVKSLYSSAEKVFAALAEGMMNFSPAENVRELCEEELDDQLSSALLGASESLNTIPIPQRDIRQFGRYFSYVEAMQQLTDEPNIIPEGAESFGGHHYMLYASAVSWEKAKAFSESVGGHLATITSQSEQDWIKKTFGASFELWIGGSDADEEGTWRWITGEKWRYANWATAEPNNLGLEHSLQMLRDGTWRDRRAKVLLCFLIEWDY
jgi:hypothetical protein